MPLRDFFLDMNAYFASAEQHLNPRLRGKPVAVVPAFTATTCCIAVSYEARPFGIRTGTNVGEAILKCPKLELVEGNHVKYVELHHQIKEAVETVLPIDEVRSIDEMSFRLMGPERNPSRAVELALDMKRAIAERVGPTLRCSIGIAPNRFLAKTASNMQKPDGLVVLEDKRLPQALYKLELEDLTGISRRMGARLRAAGISSVRDLCEASERRLGEAWGSVVGRRWALMLRGEDVEEPGTVRRQVGHSRILPPEHRSEGGARAILAHLTQKAAVRLRDYGLWCERMTMSMTTQHWERLPEGGEKVRRVRWREETRFAPCQDTQSLMEAFARLWERRRNGDGGTPFSVSVTLTDLVEADSVTPPLFPEAQRRQAVSRAIDAINDKYGTNTAYFASLQQAKEGVPVRIAFSQIPDVTRDVRKEKGA